MTIVDVSEATVDDGQMTTTPSGGGGGGVSATLLVGVGVAVAVFVLLLVVVGGYAAWRKRRSLGQALTTDRMTGLLPYAVCRHKCKCCVYSPFVIVIIITFAAA